jgi:SAM-dependent methyltransferase
MTEPVDLYGAYRNFSDRVLDAIRKETFGVDIGQNSWLTVDELERFLSWLELAAEHHVLEVASGSGGPALHLARTRRCRVTGIDHDEGAVATASRAATESGADGAVSFRVADAGSELPFGDDAFDALLCIDAMNHLPNRLGVLREWRRVLRSGGRALFTDPVVVTGAVTNMELGLRSSIGVFVFVPAGVNERLIGEAGLRLVHQEDVTENAATISLRWHRARQSHREELIRMEGETRFEGLQRFFQAVHDLSRERRLSRLVYVVEKPR